MPSLTLHFDNARFVQKLISNNTRNLAEFEKQLHVKATARDGFIKLEGEEPALENARMFFEQLESAVKSGSPISSREFKQALQVATQEGTDTLKSLLASRIVTSTRKPPISPKTMGQKKYLDAIRDNDVVLGIGPAGTGKTYLAMAMGLSALREEKISRIILTRPAVEAGEALGFLPGDLDEKLEPYLRPLQDALHDMLPADEILRYRERGTIEIAPLAYMRGRTLNNAFIILDEAQNSTREQMFMFLTRLGYNAKAVVTGDPTQVDLPQHKPSGLAEAMQALRKVENVGVMEFKKRDVVRHPLVMKIVAAYEEHRIQNK